ncbi:MULTISPECIES: GGDEF domain-containing protein [unclassified Fusibacter]|uniref:GGDEF domain-containing protein n=1 Tax=unclassified Fusibacter TaxID=2624464 RepID=UPI0010125A55|nr:MULTISPECIES: GGDEF domain-containing protein [unclassified Fusibacter]MCK8060433.1 GGDEF domain-containing protein [Fusibacter sp. A2]NPE20278.1 GGDEF domain-containing protein [Fusibacter sp. A1]RXV63484.1 GGDEF domain-containing protein [Fusibacter sp. A1]
MDNSKYELYQMNTERVKDDVLEKNRYLERKLSEKEQSFELVKMVHFDKSIDLKVLNDIIIGCTGCLHSVMLYQHQVITDLDKQSDLYMQIIDNKDELTGHDGFFVADNVIPEFTVVVYPVETSDLLAESSQVVKHIFMLYPNRFMNVEVLDFVKSFMIVNDVLINIVLTRSKMLDLIETDPMTSVLNRSSWADNLTNLVGLNEPFFMLFFDLDNFKNINDTLGHQAGDEVLINVSTWLRSTFRGSDKIFRLGGDEFAVTGSINIEQVDGLVTKLKTLNSRFNRSIQAKVSEPISVSIGALIAHKKYTENELYTKVDNLLYQSKQKGRDTITLILELPN